MELRLVDFTGLQHEVHRELPADAVVEVEDPRTPGALLPEMIEPAEKPGRSIPADGPVEEPEPPPERVTVEL